MGQVRRMAVCERSRDARAAADRTQGVRLWMGCGGGDTWLFGGMEIPQLREVPWVLQARSGKGASKGVRSEGQAAGRSACLFCSASSLVLKSPEKAPRRGSMVISLGHTP